MDCSPWGCWESDTTERFHFHFSLSCIGEGNGNPYLCSCLENPGGAWRAAVYGVSQSRKWLKWLSSSRAELARRRTHTHTHSLSLSLSLYKRLCGYQSELQMFLTVLVVMAKNKTLCYMAFINHVNKAAWFLLEPKDFLALKAGKKNQPFCLFSCKWWTTFWWQPWNKCLKSFFNGYK